MRTLFVDSTNNMFGWYESRLHWIKKLTSSEIGNIYIAKVKNKIPAQNAFFIEYEKGQIGFLRSKKDLKTGEQILVEYLTKNRENKKPRFRLGCCIFKFPYRWNTPYKIKDGVMKTYKNNLSKEKCKEHYIKLQNDIKYLTQQQDFLPIPRLLMKQNIDVDKIIYDYQIDRIITNDKLLSKRYKSVITTVYDDQYDYRYDTHITKDLVIQNQRIITLTSGATIVFDYTEAMTVVDVNSKSSIHIASEINQEAIQEIYIQLVIRNIKGIVIVDLINDTNHDELIGTISKLTKDKVYEKIKFHDVTMLNLLELTISV